MLYGPPLYGRTLPKMYSLPSWWASPLGVGQHTNISGFTPSFWNQDLCLCQGRCRSSTCLGMVCSRRALEAAEKATIKVRGPHPRLPGSELNSSWRGRIPPQEHLRESLEKQKQKRRTGRWEEFAEYVQHAPTGKYCGFHFREISRAIPFCPIPVISLPRPGAELLPCLA